MTDLRRYNYTFPYRVDRLDYDPEAIEKHRKRKEAEKAEETRRCIEAIKTSGKFKDLPPGPEPKADSTAKKLRDKIQSMKQKRS